MAQTPERKAVDARLRTYVDRLSSYTDRRPGTVSMEGASKYLENQLRAMRIPGAKIENVRVGGVPAYLSIVIRGRSKSAPKLLGMAHADSRQSDYQSPSRQGAVDNAGGVAVWLELLARFRDRDSDGDVAVVFTFDEEQTRIGGSMAYGRLSKRGFSAANTVVVNVDGIGLSDPKHPQIVVAPSLGADSPDRRWWELLGGRLRAKGLRVETLEPERVHPHQITRNDAAHLARLYQTSGVTLRAPYALSDSETDPIFHSSNDTPDKVDFSILTATAEALAEAIDDYAAVRASGRKSEPLTLVSPVAIPEVADFTPKIVSAFQREGLLFDPTQGWPMSEDAADDVIRWMKFMLQRWPSVKNVWRGLTYPVSEKLPNDLFPYAVPLNQPLRSDSNFVDPRVGVFYRSRAEHLTLSLMLKLFPKATYSARDVKIHDSPVVFANERAVFLNDIVALMHTGDVSDAILIGRTGGKNPTSTMIDISQSHAARLAAMKQFFEEQGMSWRGSPYTKDKPLSHEVLVPYIKPAQPSPSRPAVRAMAAAA
jgi:hypothetical protein